MSTLTSDVRPFTVSVPESDLEDLRARLERVRWPEKSTGEGASQGPPLAFMQRLVEHWREGYDWRRCEADLNAMNQAITTIDGLDVHFLHVPSPHPGALPLLMCHGWPGSVLEFRAMVTALTDPTLDGGDPADAFELVIPSMPGFAFSGKPDATGWGIARTATAWTALMRRLGFTRWGVHGGDWGSAVAEEITRQAPERVIALHTTMAMVFPTAQEASEADDAEQAMMADAGRYQSELSAYAAEMTTRPQTIGYSLLDSPVGLAAWIATLFYDVCDHDGDPTSAVPLDVILDDVMLYWLPAAGASAARLYYEAAREQLRRPTPEDPNPVPTGISVFPREAVRTSRRWAQKRYPNLLHHHQAERGGHFAALEQPHQLVRDLRSTFTGRRG